MSEVCESMEDKIGNAGDHDVSEVMDTSGLMVLNESQNLDTSVNTSLKINKAATESAKKRKIDEIAIKDKDKRDDQRLKREEEKRKRLEEKEKQRLEKLEELKKREEEKKRKEEEKERQRLEKLEELKKKEEEKEKLRLEREEEKRKKEEEKEKQRLEKLDDLRKKEEEKERMRLEREEEKKRKEEEKRKKDEEKQREEDEKRQKTEKTKQNFCSYFIKKEGPVQKEEEPKNLRFMPFQVKKNMYLAPQCRRLHYDEKKDEIMSKFDLYFMQQDYKSNYLKDFKKPELSGRTFPSTLELKKAMKSMSQMSEECIVVNTGTHKFRVKYLHFDPHSYRRPPYYGTWRKKSKFVNPKKPFGKDADLVNYENDSDDEWEDGMDGESIGSKEDEEETIEDEEDEDDGFFVPHGYLSDDEIDEDNREVPPEVKEAEQQAKRSQWENEQKKKNVIVTAKFYGCVWDAKHSDYKILRKYQMVQLAPMLPVQVNYLPEAAKNNAEETPKSNKLKQNNKEPNPSPSHAQKSKSKPKAPQSASQVQKIPQSASATSTPSTPSIMKFISKTNRRSNSPIVIVPLDGSFSHTNVAEKRVCSEEADTVVKRLKLDSNDQVPKEEEMKDADATNKENDANCIIVE